MTHMLLSGFDELPLVYEQIISFVRNIYTLFTRPTRPTRPTFLEALVPPSEEA